MNYFGYFLIALGVLVYLGFTFVKDMQAWLKKRWRFLYVTWGCILVSWGAWWLITGGADTPLRGSSFWFAIAFIINSFLILLARLDR
ncbi:hypothetical protein AYK26_00615 [Euryarchaeota archaeon SM23-78]|nr:MAG: hypothetical protein AYK26_00615 [Euryarchaeota archaeon SM23-78]